MTDRTGAIYAGREGLNWIKKEMAKATNLNKEQGTRSSVFTSAINSKDPREV